jgi:hypothetical protein
MEHIKDFKDKEYYTNIKNDENFFNIILVIKKIKRTIKYISIMWMKRHGNMEVITQTESTYFHPKIFRQSNKEDIKRMKSLWKFVDRDYLYYTIKDLFK